MFLGIDIGSSSSKVALIDLNNNVLFRGAVNIGTGSEAINALRKKALQESSCTEEDVLYTVVTGYGRGIYEYADAQVTEISCHAKGAYFLHPQARTIIDIGGQDSKVIRIDEYGNVEDFVMNEKCAAGTGRFLEVITRVLGCKMDELSDLAYTATNSVSISNTCTVFAESEMISQLAMGSKKEEVANGAHISIAKRIYGLATRVGIVPEVVMTGGVALNKHLVDSLSIELETKVTIVDNPQTVGALGAALFAKEKYLKLHNNV